jgi:hypothetical protein
MTTYFPFRPSNRVAPQFSPIFDGQSYTIIVMWNISSQRYYLNCKDIQNNLIFMLPLIESPPALPIKSLVYSAPFDPHGYQKSWVITKTVNPHNIEIADVLQINIINCVPAAYNGYVEAIVLSETEILYSMTTNPGIATTLGQIDMPINMINGYFDSTLVFRNKMFEVNP